MISYSVVISTLARPCLESCLTALAAAHGPYPRQVVLVDDRAGHGGAPSHPVQMPAALADAVRVEVITAGGVGPATARNLGWRHTDTPWVVFLDDDVRVAADWRERLAADLTGQPASVGGVQGQITVPHRRGRRRPTDWERCTARLAQARWITADMAYRREALVESGGFDERFPRAFREDADLALRVLADGWHLRAGVRRTDHPIRPESPWVSLRAQAGNADDALMRALHGPHWHALAGEKPGRRPRHAAITAAAVAATALAAVGHRKLSGAVGAAALAGIAEFAAARIRPGPHTPRELAVMAATSALIPPAAMWHWSRGAWAARHAQPWPGAARAILFDRDGTLVHDVPYNGDPRNVRPMPGAREALDLARGRGLGVGVVTNQSGIARDLVRAEEVAAVNRRVTELLGPFDTWQVCPHGEGDGCACRKPAPGMVNKAAAELGVPPHECVVVGDIAADLAAARAAGARAVLVPTPRTRDAELLGARVAAGLVEAVRFALAEIPGPAIWR